ncbi:MAG TPA: tetratricopeptide repeat protein [Chloroflexota bacterium]|nr:tetratricopeptide repeat protein [Chloroflexota bacterium]
MTGSEDPDVAPFGVLLRAFRRGARMSQAQLATEAGFSTVYIGMLERGSRLPPETTVVSLARALDLSSSQVEQMRSAAFGTQPALDGQLPRALTSFVGRRREIAVLRDMLSEPDVRLVTVTGPGGVGKTRLAVEVARSLRHDFDDGVIFVPLDALTHPGSVPGAIVSALGLKPRTDISVTDVLREYLAEKQLLLVLDNFEHLLPAATAIAGVLTRASHVRALVTSRIRLGQSGEHVFAVRPLAAPRGGALQTSRSYTQPAIGAPHAGTHQAREPVAAVADSDAARLFLDRVRATDPTFSLNRHNAALVAEVCRLLDGLPLALELAAARACIFPLELITGQLRQPILYSAASQKEPEARHQSLAATFEWSFRLLDEPVQRAFASLSVFLGGFTLEGAAQILGLGERGTQDTIATLVDASFLWRDEGRAGCRFVMLQPVRDFGLEKLREMRSEEDVRRRHLDLMARLAEQFSVGVAGPDPESWMRRLEDEAANVISAVEWSAGFDPLRGLHIAGWLAQFWESQPRRADGLRLLESLFELVSSNPQLASDEADSPHSETLARAFVAASGMAWTGGDEKLARQYGDAALRLYRLLPHGADFATALIRMGNVHMLGGRVEEARSLYREGLTMREALEDVSGIYGALNNLGVANLALGEYDEASRALQQAIALSRSHADVRSTGRAMNNLGFALLYQGSLDEALRLAREALTMRHEIDDVKGVAESLELVAGVLAGKGQSLNAAYLLGASGRLRAERDLAYGLVWLQVLMEDVEARLIEALGVDAYSAIKCDGGTAPTEDSVAVALGSRRLREPSCPNALPATPPQWHAIVERNSSRQ